MIKLNSATLIWVVLYALLLSNCSSTDKKTKTQADKKAELYYNHGTAALLKKDYTDALDKLLKANEIKPDDSKTLNNLGMAFYFKRRHHEAKKYLSQAIKLDPKNSDAKINLASIYYHLGELGKAKELYINVLNDLVYRHQYRTHYNLALIYLKEGNKKEAIKSLNEALAIREEYCVAYYTLGQIARNDYDYFSAIKWFKKGSKGTCYNEPAPHYEEALVYLDLKKYEKATLKLEEVASRFPKSKYAMMANMRLKNIRRSNFLTKEMLENIELQKMKKMMERVKNKENEGTELLNSPTF